MEEYVTKTGVKLNYNKIDDSYVKTHKDKYIKVNIPDSLNSYETGNGEGMWAMATNEEDYKKIIDDNSKSELVVVQLHNDCFYYQDDIKFLDYIVVETRGFNRSVVPYSEVEDYFCFW